MSVIVIIVVSIRTSCVTCGAQGTMKIWGVLATLLRIVRQHQQSRKPAWGSSKWGALYDALVACQEPTLIRRGRSPGRKEEVGCFSNRAGPRATGKGGSQGPDGDRALRRRKNKALVIS